MEVSRILRPAVENVAGLQTNKTTGAGSKATEGINFSQALDALSQSQVESDVLIQKLAAGEDVDLHTVMIAGEQADINFRVALAIRDRLVDAYREVMRMSV